MEMLLTGELMSAEEAVRFGLVNRAVPRAELDGAAMALARRLASKSSYTLKIGKEAFYRQLELGLEDAYAYASEVMLENMLAADAEEGISAFVEKRKPQWRDR
jgi:enoyl-CoA hydratase/carnithine racemase